jgi:hypothetical protein
VTAEFGLMMPFVVCASNGGPYDDEPYCAGFEAGMVDTILATTLPGINQMSRPVRTDNLPQIDLIAMQHGWTITPTVDDEHPEWTTVTFSRRVPLT